MSICCWKATQDVRERYAPPGRRFELMQELALKLNRKRVKRGSIDFDLPEPLIEFDTQGEMIGVVRSAAQHRAPDHRRVHAGGE